MSRRTGITFGDMGGVGKIRCLECGHSKKVISAIHGLFTPSIRDAHGTIITPGDYNFRCSIGYQCLACGKFAQISSNEDSPVAPGKCKCGGKLSRDHVLFCPKCKSKKLEYHMDYIT